MIRRTLLLFGLIFCAAHAHATNCALTSGANQSAIQTAITAAGSSSCTGTSSATTVAFGIGTFGPITSTITLPCNVNLIGPAVAYSQTPNQTAVIDGSSGFSGLGFQTTSGCGSLQTIKYLQWNGEHANTKTNGGGFIQINAGTTNLSILNNYLHGADTIGANFGSVSNASIQVFFAGTSTTTSNVLVQWNLFGGTTFGDCDGAFSSPGGTTPEQDAGSNCNGVGIQNNVSNITITNNNFTNLEEDIKVYESNTPSCNNVVINNNSFNQIWRIYIETQCYTGNSALMYIQYNNTIGKYGTTGTSNIWTDGWSIANGCVNALSSTCITHNDYNNLLEINSAIPGNTGNEIWGTSASSPATNYATSTTTTYNLYQGYWQNGIIWSPSGSMILNNNTFNIVNGGSTSCGSTSSWPSGGYWQVNNNPTSGGVPVYSPTCTGNTFSTAITGTYASAAPSFSYSSPVLTITNSGTNRDINTTAWCTTDGTTPVPGSGTAVPYWTAATPGLAPSSIVQGTITISGTQTVKCVGMWGALNQPYSYPSGYSYVPSSVVSGTYSSCTNCVATPVVSASGGTVTITTSTPGAGIWYTTDGSTPTLPPGGVPQGTSSNYTPMCKAVVQPPLGDLKNITAYGAVAGGTDNTTAIYNACVAAGPAQSGGPSAQTSGIYIPAGVWYAGNFVYGSTPLNCNIYGQGQSSEIYCPSATVNGNNCQMYSTGNNLVWSNFSHQMPFTTRDATNFNMGRNAGSNTTIDTVLVVGGNAGGIQNNGDSNAINTNNGIFNTGADCNYHVGGATNDVTDHEYVYNCGDDSVSNVTYTPGSTAYTTGSLIQWNNLGNNACPACARGISVLGGTNMTFQDNLIQNIKAAGIFIAQENPSAFPEDNVSNILARYNYVTNTNTNATGFQGGITVESDDPGGVGVTNVGILGNYVVNTSSGSALTFWDGASNISNMSYTNNTLSGTTGAWENTGTGTNIQCTGNTYNGTANNSGAICGGTNPSTATGSSVTYSGCVVGTAKQYTGSFTASGTINAIAVFPGLPNSSIGSGFATPPALTSCSQTNSGSVSSITVGQYVQQTAQCYYASVPTTTNCSTADTYGNAVTAWGAISGTAISNGAVGAGSGCSSGLQGAGCVKGVSAGTASATATVTGGVSCTSYPFTVTAVTPTLNSATMVVQSGGSTVYVAGQVTMCVNLAYITPTANTQQCGNGTDAYGTVVSGFASSVPSDATIVGSTGVLTGVAAGSTTVSASVNSGAYTPSLVVTVATPPVTPAAAMQGISGLQGNAGIQ